jgi:hypothetical protein
MIPSKFTHWDHASIPSLAMDVDGRGCAFENIPRYFFSMVAKSTNRLPPAGIAGLGSVCRPSRNGFRIIVSHPTLSTNDILLALNECEVSWLGKMGTGTGITRTGHTGWQTHKQKRNVIYTDVLHRSSATDFTTALQGQMSHAGAEFFFTRGGNVVFDPTSTGFRIFVEAINLSPDIDNLASFAEDHKWVVSWAAMSQHSTDQTGRAQWQPSGHGIGADEHTKHSRNLFELRLALLKQHSKAAVMVPSISVNSSVWMPSTNSPVLKQTDIFGRRGFTVYVSGGAHNLLSLDALQQDWRVSFMLYERKPHVIAAKLLIPGNHSSLALYTTTDGQSKLAGMIAEVLGVPPTDIRFFQPKLGGALGDSAMGDSTMGDSTMGDSTTGDSTMGGAFVSRMAIRVDNAHVSHRVFQLLHGDQNSGVTSTGELDRRFDPPVILEGVKELRIDDGTVESEDSYLTLVMGVIGVLAFGMVTRWSTVGGRRLEVHTDPSEMQALKPAISPVAARQQLATRWDNSPVQEPSNRRHRAEEYIAMHAHSLELEEDRLDDEEDAGEQQGLFSIDLGEDAEKRYKEKRRDRFSKGRKANVRVVGGGMSFEESVGLDQLGL